MKYKLQRSGPDMRIVALKAFNGIKIGEVGGVVEDGNSLSQEGSCWIDYDASVRGDARVYGNARVCASSRIYMNAKVYGNAYVIDAVVHDSAQIYGDAIVKYAFASGSVQIYGNAKILSRCWLRENVKVYDNATICILNDSGYVDIQGDVLINKHAYISSAVNFAGEVEISSQMLANVQYNFILSTDGTITYCGASKTVREWSEDKTVDTEVVLAMHTLVNSVKEIQRIPFNNINN